MSTKKIIVRKIPDGEIMKVSIDNDNGLDISTLERVFPKIRILGYYDEDQALSL